MTAFIGPPSVSAAWGVLDAAELHLSMNVDGPPPTSGPFELRCTISGLSGSEVATFCVTLSPSGNAHAYVVGGTESMGVDTSGTRSGGRWDFSIALIDLPQIPRDVVGVLNSIHAGNIVGEAQQVRFSDQR